MAEQVAIGGGDRMLEISEDEVSKGSNLMQKVQVLEKEKDELIRTNEAGRDKISKLEEKLAVLESEKAELEKEIARLDNDKKMLEPVAARADELEAEVSRLQHVLSTVEEDWAKANKELIEIRSNQEMLKESDLLVKQKLDVVQKEKALLLKKVEDMDNEYRAAKELERENETKLMELRKRFEDLELVKLKNGEVMTKSENEIEKLKGENSSLEGLLEKSAEKIKELEEICRSREKTLDGMNGILHVIENGEKGIFGVKLQWPILAASTGVVITAGALWYMRTKQR